MTHPTHSTHLTIASIAASSAKQLLLVACCAVSNVAQAAPDLPLCPVEHPSIGHFIISQGDTGGCDLAPVWDEAMRQHIAETEQNIKGPLVDIRYGHQYHASATLIIGMETTLRGICENCVTIRTSTTAIQCAHRVKARHLQRGDNGDCDVSNLMLLSTAPPGADMHVGVDVDKKAKLADMTIQGFGIGVEMDCGVARPGLEASNCNTTRLARLAIYNSRGPGLYINGPDAGGGHFTSILLLNNCTEAKWDYVYTPHVPCAAAISTQMLGNTWIGGHGEGQARQMPHFVLGQNGNAADVAILYTEGDAYVDGVRTRGLYGPRTRVFGNGADEWHPIKPGRGAFVSGERVSGVQLLNRIGDHTIELLLGEAAGVEDTAWVMRRDGGDWLYWKYVPQRYGWGWLTRNSRAMMPFVLISPRDTAYKQGALRLLQEPLVGY